MPIRYALIRHLLAIVVLPLTIAVIIPALLVRRYEIGPLAVDGVGDLLSLGLGSLLLLVGAALFFSSLYQIVMRGEGTLAPWDPPRRLVVKGPYRHVRNPMISGVLFVLFGEAVLWQSLVLALYALLFLGINLLYIPLLEEPQIEARFGDEYRRYRRHVSRFLPRVRSWHPEAE
jgi:protein-S-isoprenylcysteine O-methyltransferase Ste14